MKKLIGLAAVCAVAFLGLGLARAADPGTEKKADAKPAKVQKLPFHGEVKAVDQTAKTFALGEHTYSITSDTKIYKAGKPATFAELTAGDDVAGSYKKVSADKWEVLSLKIGKPPADTKPKK